MTDFFADLETELLGAARRRATGAAVPRRRRAARRPFARAVVVACTVAALGAGAIAVRPGADEAAIQRPAPPAGGVTPDVPPPVGDCLPSSPRVRTVAGLPPRPVLDTLGILPREPRSVAARAPGRSRGTARAARRSPSARRR